MPKPDSTERWRVAMFLRRNELRFYPDLLGAMSDVSSQRTAVVGTLRRGVRNLPDLNRPLTWFQ
jgi:hypothetical protein